MTVMALVKDKETGEVTPGEREFNQCVGYQRIDELKASIQPLASRVTKEEVLDLPPKLYTKRYVELTPEQKRVYMDVRDEAIALLGSGELVTAPLAITRLLRLHQVTCGYIPTDDGVVRTFEKNPKLESLVDACRHLYDQTIIFCRFHHDIDSIMGRLGAGAVRYDGRTSNDERAKSKDRFQAGDAQFFVANSAAAGTGLTLTAARNVLYYSNSLKLVDRLQSEDRPHRIGQTHPVTYVDFVAPGTVDVKIVAALRNKLEIAREVTGDRLKEWI
jgi:SNF2 family DNA or RNA helicase